MTKRIFIASAASPHSPPQHPEGVSRLPYRAAAALPDRGNPADAGAHHVIGATQPISRQPAVSRRLLAKPGDRSLRGATRDTVRMDDVLANRPERIGAGETRDDRHPDAER